MLMHGMTRVRVASRPDASLFPVIVTPARGIHQLEEAA
jgi:hypothetical protein